MTAIRLTSGLPGTSAARRTAWPVDAPGGALQVRTESAPHAHPCATWGMGFRSGSTRSPPSENLLATRSATAPSACWPVVGRTGRSRTASCQTGTPCPLGRSRSSERCEGSTHPLGEVCIRYQRERLSHESGACRPPGGNIRVVPGVELAPIVFYDPVRQLSAAAQGVSFRASASGTSCPTRSCAQCERLCASSDGDVNHLPGTG